MPLSAEDEVHEADAAARGALREEGLDLAAAPGLHHWLLYHTHWFLAGLHVEGVAEFHGVGFGVDEVSQRREVDVGEGVRTFQSALQNARADGAREALA